MLTENFVPQIDKLSKEVIATDIDADVLRLDAIHPIISGNKWFKLKEYLADAKKKNKSTVLTFGGAYSNHIVATAAACKTAGFASIGIIRGEVAKEMSHTLKQAKELGMELRFVSRELYRQKHLPESLESGDEIYVIDEGGYGLPGAEGAKDILASIPSQQYTHILAAVGTGTTLAGLIQASHEQQAVIGVSALKNNLQLADQINALLPEVKKNNFVLLHDYHFGGYAKYKPELIHFMNHWFKQTTIPLDFVYTAKLFFAFKELCAQHFFRAGSKVLLIHSGGLQGNRSLKPGKLIF